MAITPANIKRCTLTWDAPDYSTSYPAGYTERGVAVIAVAEEAQQAQGFCYSSTATLVYVSKESGERIPLNTEPILGEHAHSLMEPCEVVHTKMLGRAVLEAWELIPRR
ncbi:hypothetical protein RA11412_0817 [Rothia aeria]|uniref:Uncharacterized protein n=1 Tax=Rothia aeria TaxID=172042 RepID=A0A2Z5QXR5_9MICC|nr:hypothetical protein RA11412_0817 [Rothia aeria]